MSFSYGAKIVTDGLVFYVDAANPNSYVSGSTTVDSLVSNVTGSLSNDTDFSTDNQGVWVFDGVDDNITTPYNDILDITSITIQCWLNLTGAQQLYPTVFGRAGGGSAAYKIRTYGGVGSDIGLQIYDSTYRQGPKLTTGVSGKDLNYGEWNFLSFSYDYNSIDGQRFKVYLNGVLDSQSTTGVGTIVNTSQTMEFMESDFDSNSNLAGSLGPCNIYNRELTSTEVLQNYNALKGRFGL